jgi:nucleotide-binding universal stress UspA family protein
MAQHQKILVAVDQSDLSESIFETALHLAKANQADLMIAHCYTMPTPTNFEFGDRYRTSVKEFMAIAQQEIDASMDHISQWLTALTEQAKTAGVNASWDWQGGEAGPNICQLAKEWQADLIVLGRRGRNGLTEAVLGSVSNYVAHRAPCSVLVVKGTH